MHIKLVAQLYTHQVEFSVENIPFYDLYPIFEKIVESFDYPNFFPYSYPSFFNPRIYSVRNYKQKFNFEVHYSDQCYNLLIHDYNFDLSLSVFDIHSDFPNANLTLISKNDFNSLPNNKYYDSITKIVHHYHPSNDIFKPNNPKTPTWYPSQHHQYITLYYLCEIFARLHFYREPFQNIFPNCNLWRYQYPNCKNYYIISKPNYLFDIMFNSFIVKSDLSLFDAVQYINETFLINK